MNDTEAKMVLETVNSYARALNEIARMPLEENEWDGVEKYRNCRFIAQSALSWATDDPGAPYSRESA